MSASAVLGSANGDAIGHTFPVAAILKQDQPAYGEMAQIHWQMSVRHPVNPCHWN